MVTKSQQPGSTATRAMIRGVASGYAAAYGGAIDMDLARLQHRGYAAALAAAGLAVTGVEPDERFYDCVFIEDTAVIWDGRALLGRMAGHREGEQAGVARVLAATHQLVRVPVGATLDGGDVMHGEGVTYVGISSRTNEAGAEALAEFLAPTGRRVVRVPVRRCLHLKSAATWLGNGAVLVAPELMDERAFEAASAVLHTAAGEEGAANTLRISRHLLIVEGYPRTAATLGEFADRHGLELVRMPMSEFQKGGGSLTCLSLVW